MAQGRTQEAHNTSREIWREIEGDYYSPSLAVTEDGFIAVQVGGMCTVWSIRQMFKRLTSESCCKGGR